MEEQNYSLVSIVKGAGTQFVIVKHVGTVDVENSVGMDKAYAYAIEHSKPGCISITDVTELKYRSIKILNALLLKKVMPSAYSFISHCGILGVILPENVFSSLFTAVLSRLATLRSVLVIGVNLQNVSSNIAEYVFHKELAHKYGKIFPEDIQEAYKSVKLVKSTKKFYW